MATRARSIVAAGHPATAEAALALLDGGGNAFDAAVAAGFAAAVCEPGFTSLGGGGFLLARTEHRPDVVFDFFVDTPGRGRADAAVTPAFDEVSVDFGAAVQRFHCGPGSVAVPGALAGYLHVHAALGRAPLAAVVAPAVELARGGVEVSETQAYVLGLLEPILVRTAASRALFCPTGRVLGVGEVLRNPDLADYLEALGADPRASFHQGDLARRLVEDLRSGGGLLTEQDLADYRVVERRPLEVRYRDRHLRTNPPPTFGGALVGLALRRLEDAGPAAPRHGVEWARRHVGVMAGIDRDRAAAHPEVVAALAEGLDGRLNPRGTTHVSVADAEGNVAAMTTSNGECSGDVVAGTGIATNNMLGEDDLHPDGFHAFEPGVRVASMMAPTFVLDDRGSVEVALGSGGSKRIRTALGGVISALVDDGLGLADAIDAPRLHWDADHLEVEPGLPEPTLAALAADHPVNVWPGPNLYFGGVHAVAPGRSGAADGRRGGAVRSG